MSTHKNQATFSTIKSQITSANFLTSAGGQIKFSSPAINSVGALL